ncbi:hypothetical protein [Marinimicrobium sp. ABcell2]|uniref:hypothetical protein n=1 Tax=Marinimicrobium sp. ABcell2 TaxID=3069751 RepID=UPI0027B85638|nr:hypothetical protein [Marinimicrobium sp. ABcell2]MDQ2077207.1 hypothetical protein [Marinimicrobium sp. ABcell2]
MNKTESNANWKAGYWSAILCAAFSLLYIVLQLAEWLGLLGSAGGPESASTPLGVILLLTPSLLLAPSFIVLIVAVHCLIPESRRVWGLAGIAFSAVYAALIGIVYYVQLSFVVPRMLQGRTDDIELLLFTPFDSFLYSVDLLGYSFMSLAALSAALGLAGLDNTRTARWFLLATGLLLPFLLFQIYFNQLIYIAALWAITFPGAAIALAMVFKRKIIHS